MIQFQNKKHEMSNKIILIGNYAPDKQFSMQIFEVLMAQGYKKSNFRVTVIRPNEIFRKLGFSRTSLVKWLGYIDKFLVFPIKLLLIRVVNFIFLKKVRYHICDHSNAIYLYFLPKNSTIITCHDVLAIRAGLGYSDTYCYATKSGMFLQKIILNALSSAPKLAAVSKFTLKQLEAIDTKPNGVKKWVCIHNALSQKFVPLTRIITHSILTKFTEIKNKSFILHVGSDLERKNRKLLIQMIFELQNKWDGILVLAGEKLNPELLDFIQNLNISNRIAILINPTNKEIVALYSECQALVFPSFSEGFGWPIIEAQACGAPVITSNIAPMMFEVGGNAALYADPKNASSFVEQFLKLQDQDFRNKIIKLGHKNVEKFDFDTTIANYVELLKY